MNFYDIFHINYLRVGVFALCLVFTSCKDDVNGSENGPFNNSSSEQMESNDFAFLFEQISDLHNQDLVVGAEVLIIRNDTIQLHEVVGWSDKEKGIKLQKNTIHRIRSMTKPIVATAILILLDEGKLSLDDSIASYIPAFDNPRSRQITIQQLLTHTTGLINHDYEEIGLSKPPHEFETLEQVVDEIGQIGPIVQPGKYYYSGSGIATLTRLISIISGVSADTFIQERIFKPLNMADSYTRFRPGDAWANKLNPTYRWSDSIKNFKQYWNATMEPEYKYFRGHGGVYSTAIDYAKFMSLYLNEGKFNNKRILSEQIIKQAQSILVPLPLKAPESHQSLAWKILIADTLSNDIGYFQHVGSDGTMAYAYPKEKTIALYFNQSRNHPRFIFEDLMAVTPPYDAYRKWSYNNEYLDQWKEILLRDKQEKSNELNKQYEAFLGTYKCTNNDGFSSEIFLKNEQLIIKNLRSGNEITLSHYKENEFICRFWPPTDGFISKVVFSEDYENAQSFTLEWLNTTKFEFEKIK